jgi:hypothetical protein
MKRNEVTSSVDEKRWRCSCVVSSVEFCKGGYNKRTWAREPEESPLLKVVARERLLKTLKAGEDLACSDL